MAGFDLTFSVPKSVSVLWALADEQTRGKIVASHHDAVAHVLAVAERDVVRTRVGHAGLAQVETRGVIAAGFDHYDSRAGDPRLHTHVTVANRVQGPDGRWRTVYSRRLFQAAVALSETYDAVLADNMTRSLGLGWEWRRRGPGRNPARELAAVPPELVAEFSKRSAAIDTAKDAAIAAFTQTHGRAPTAAEALRIRQRATLSTRDPKRTRPLAGYTAAWRERAAAVLGQDPLAWAQQVTGRHVHVRLRSAEDVTAGDVRGAGGGGAGRCPGAAFDVDAVEPAGRNVPGDHRPWAAVRHPGGSVGGAGPGHGGGRGPVGAVEHTGRGRGAGAVA